ncbi:hypothetical protein SALBM217S_05957 [Streptomyces griseoloalbus]|uniref:IclR-ED domain-containing protein n=1 Tax=Streptomyces pseudogriseolus TaxID=36817 RepID=A0ABQ2TNC9_STREZ|nr:hypothetical protein GCM10010285_62990 [Streptomyces rubiginosus]
MPDAEGIPLRGVTAAGESLEQIGLMIPTGTTIRERCQAVANHCREVARLITRRTGGGAA